MHLKEYRICMPITTDEYRRGQQYMISRHSDEQSETGEGVEVICNEPHYDPNYGHGKYTEKRIHLNSRLPSWVRAVTPALYVTEKAWNYYPYTVTEYSCHFLPRLLIFVETRYENNNGKSDSESASKFCRVKEHVTEADLLAREIDHVDIAMDKVPDKSYKENEDCTIFHSKRTGRGPLTSGWRDSSEPIMCSYKLVLVKFEVWGLQTKVEAFIQRSIRDILLVSHRQAFAWIDVWYGDLSIISFQEEGFCKDLNCRDMSLDNIKQYEMKIQAQTNSKVTGLQRTNSKSKKAKKKSDSTSSSTTADSFKSVDESEEQDLFVDAPSIVK